MINMTSYHWAIEELVLSGRIGLGPCHPSTVYRWVREINHILTFEKCDWRVKADIKNREIYVVNQT